MRKVAVSVLLFGVLATGFVAGIWYNQRERVDVTSPGARRVLYYVDPMHPAYTSDKPGTAPDCGMQLQPIYDDVSEHTHREPAGPSAAAGAVRIGPEEQQLIGVRTAAVETVTHTETLRLYGRVAPDETRLYRINVGTDGVVRDLSAATTGSRVRRDEWLATLAAPEVRAPIQGYLIALDVLDRTRKTAEGSLAVEATGAGLQQAIDRLLTLGMSSAQIEEIGRTRQVPATLQITAPEHGVLVARNVSIGQKVMRGEELYRLADLRRVWILADVFGRNADYLRPGMRAEVSLPDRPRRFGATVSRELPPQSDLANAPMQVRLEADNPDLLLRPGMFVDVDLPIVLPPALAVPVGAVIDSGLTTTVFVERSPGMFEPREVETGWRFGERVQILSGLDSGERIVVAGTFLLDAESRLRNVTRVATVTRR